MGQKKVGFKSVLVLALVALSVLSACSRAPETTQSTNVANGWITFQGNWTANGTKDTLRLGGERRATLTSFDGTLFLSGNSSLGVGFRSEAVVFNDTSTGMIGRAVWTDDKGNKIFSELHGQDTASGKNVAGTFLGGTGPYTGATGSYAFTWRFVIDTEDGRVQGQTDDVSGRIKVGQQS